MFISLICILIIFITIQYRVNICIPEYYTNEYKIENLNDLTIPQEFYTITSKLPIHHYARENDESFFINILNIEKNDINIDLSKEYKGELSENYLLNINNYLVNLLNNKLSNDEIFKYQNIYSKIKKSWVIENNLIEKFTEDSSLIDPVYLQNNSSNNQQYVISVSKQYIQSSNNTQDIDNSVINNQFINNQFIKNTLAASTTQDYTQFIPTDKQDFAQFIKSSNNDFALYYKASNLNQLFNATISNNNVGISANSTLSNDYIRYTLTSSNNYKKTNTDYNQTLSNNYSNEDYLSYNLNTTFTISQENYPTIINQAYEIKENFIDKNNYLELNNFDNVIIISPNDNINKYIQSENILYNNSILGILSDHLIYRDTKSYGLNISLLTIHNLNSNIILKDFNINGYIYEDKINTYKTANLIDNDYQNYGTDHVNKRDIIYEENTVCQHYKDLRNRGIFGNTNEFDCSNYLSNSPS